MKFGKIFKKYKLSLLWEGIIRSVLWGLAAACAVLFAVSLGYHLYGEKMPGFLMLILTASVFSGIGLTLFFLLFYPTRKRVILRMDEAGLEERVGTMYQFKDESSTMAACQRADAMDKIQKLSSRALVNHITLKEIWLSALSVVLALVMLALPADLLSLRSSAEISEEEQKRQELVENLIDDLRKEIENAKNDPEVAEELNKIVDELEKNLLASDSKLDNVSDILNAKDKIDGVLDKEILDASTENNKELQNKLEKEKDRLDEILEDAKKEFSGEKEEERKEIVDNLIEALRKEIEEAGNEPQLEEALNAEVDDLESALHTSDSREQNISDIQKAKEKIDGILDEAIEQAEEEDDWELADALLEEKERLDQLLEDAMKELKGEEPEESETSEGESGEGPSGEESASGEGDQSGEEQPSGEGEKPGEGESLGNEEDQNPEDQFGAGLGEGYWLSMLEEIYDPVSGNVKYGEVISLYYNAYLKAVRNGEVSSEDQKLIDAYFKVLMEQG